MGDYNVGRVLNRSCAVPRVFLIPFVCLMIATARGQAQACVLAVDGDLGRCGPQPQQILTPPRDVRTSSIGLINTEFGVVVRPDFSTVSESGLRRDPNVDAMIALVRSQNLKEVLDSLETPTLSVGSWGAPRDIAADLRLDLILRNLSELSCADLVTHVERLRTLQEDRVAFAIKTIGEQALPRPGEEEKNYLAVRDAVMSHRAPNVNYAIEMLLYPLGKRPCPAAHETVRSLVELVERQSQRAATVPCHESLRAVLDQVQLDIGPALAVALVGTAQEPAAMLRRAEALSVHFEQSTTLHYETPLTEQGALAAPGPGMPYLRCVTITPGQLRALATRQDSTP